MGDFVYFLRLFDHRIHSYVVTELIFIENVKYRLRFYIKFVSFKIFDIYGPKSIIFGAYA